MSSRPWALLAALTLGACSRGPDWEWTTPRVVEQAELDRLLLPRAGETLVLASFWATW